MKNVARCFFKPSQTNNFRLLASFKNNLNLKILQEIPREIQKTIIINHGVILLNFGIDDYKNSSLFIDLNKTL
jgi:hypothetical protein